MKNAELGLKRQKHFILAGCVTLLSASWALADWPQWRGPDRDGKASGFTEPKTWPAQLGKGWETAVGAGDATPALVGDKLYVFARRDADEVIVCLDAASGKQLWMDKYPSEAISGPAGSHPGPRGSPAVADGKVVMLGANGTISCLDAATGKLVWRKDSRTDFSEDLPRFNAAASPLIVDKACVVPLGGSGKGAVVALDLETGATKWRYDGDGITYSSPVVMTVAGATDRAVDREIGRGNIRCRRQNALAIRLRRRRHARRTRRWDARRSWWSWRRTLLAAGRRTRGHARRRGAGDGEAE